MSDFVCPECGGEIECVVEWQINSRHTIDKDTGEGVDDRGAGGWLVSRIVRCKRHVDCAQKLPIRGYNIEHQGGKVSLTRKET